LFTVLLLDARILCCKNTIKSHLCVASGDKGGPMNQINRCAHEVLKRLWSHYTGLVVDARTIEQSLRKRGDVWSEDHVAFRTLPGEHTGKHILERVFTALGYRVRDHYVFKDKHLNAFWMEPPCTEGKTCDAVAPKVFISELELSSFTPTFQKVVREATSQVKANPVGPIEELAARVKAGDSSAEDPLVALCFQVLSQGAPWARPAWLDYETLRKESEYAAWTLVFGFNINHFTVSVQLMKTFKSIHELNRHIEEELTIPMNQVGGLTKGTPELRLEQSSTLAVEVQGLFQDGLHTLPYAFVEFAYRYPLEGKLASGQWHDYYQGFVVNNADKIFESTNLR
jgi:hypothetical protein